MLTRSNMGAALALVVALVTSASGWGCSAETRDFTSSSTSSGAGSSDGGHTGAGGGGGAGGHGGGMGGAGGHGGATASHGPAVSESVSAGRVSKSPGYTMIFTLGEPAQGQGTMKTSSYRLQGGLIGANGSLP